MHILSIFKVVGALLMVLGVVQLVPMAVSFFYGDTDWGVFLQSSFAVFVSGGALALMAHDAREISIRDGFVAVTIVWIAAAVAGALPYYFTLSVPTFTDAMFESMSGFTTTGATVFADYSGLSHGLLLWRSLTQWFGGMGIIVLALVVLPALGIGGMQLYKREVPGPYSDKITPRIRDTAKALWGLYLALTAVVAVVLYALGMTLFEAVNHALTTVATGGFSTRGDSIAGFQSPAIEWAIIFFMFVAGMNFSLHYRLLARPGNRWGYFADPEWKWYAAVVLLASLAVGGYLLWHEDYPAGRALTKGTFQVVALLTTTGYVSDDYMQWGAFAQLTLLLLMLSGGCAGSTSGGIKWVRILLVFKNLRLQLLKLVHPHVVVQVKMRHVAVTREIQSNIYTFLILFFTTLAVITVLVSLDGHSLLTSLGAATSAVANIGPAFDAVGPTENFSALSAYVKWVLIAGMLMGRLELMTVFVLFFPATWRR